MKLILHLTAVWTKMSPPVRGRGLKLVLIQTYRLQQPVAPRAGAWIETEDVVLNDADCAVAPRAGAWIETREIGYKDPIVAVAPRAGAWIETIGRR